MADAAYDKVAVRRNYSEHILYIDDDLPVRSAGGGMPRAYEVLAGLVGLGFEVTFVPLGNLSNSNQAEGVTDQVERPFIGDDGLEGFIRSRPNFFSRMLVSRPHNMAVVARMRTNYPNLFEGIELIYDAEALFATRERQKAELFGLQRSADDLDELMHAELGLALGANRVTTVNELERTKFRSAGARNVDLLSYPVDVVPTSRSFASRQDILFVGRMEEDDSPNVDSVIWFANQVMPLIDEFTFFRPTLFLVGRANAPRIQALRNPRVVVVGEAPDVRPWYDACRVFVAPTRFAAGIPIKVCDACAAGIPAIMTDLLLDGLGWRQGPALRSGTTSRDLARSCAETYHDELVWDDVRATELELVTRDFSRPAFDAQLERIFGPRSFPTAEVVGKTSQCTVESEAR